MSAKSTTDATTKDITANEPLLQSFFVGSLQTTLDSFFSQLAFEGYMIYNQIKSEWQLILYSDESALSTYLRSGSLPPTSSRSLFGAFLSFYEIPSPSELQAMRERLRTVPAAIARRVLVPLLKTAFGSKHSMAVLLKMAPCWPVT